MKCVASLEETSGITPLASKLDGISVAGPVSSRTRGRLKKQIWPYKKGPASGAQHTKADCSIAPQAAAPHGLNVRQKQSRIQSAKKGFSMFQGLSVPGFRRSSRVAPETQGPKVRSQRRLFITRLFRSTSASASEPIPAEQTIIMLGLDNGGKTTLVQCLASAQGQRDQTPQPTVGFRNDVAKIGSTPLTIFDVGGGIQIRGIWDAYYADVHAAVFVVDAADSSRFPEARAGIAMPYQWQAHSLPRWQVRWQILKLRCADPPPPTASTAHTNHHHHHHHHDCRRVSHLRFSTLRSPML